MSCLIVGLKGVMPYRFIKLWALSDLACGLKLFVFHNSLLASFTKEIVSNIFFVFSDREDELSTGNGASKTYLALLPFIPKNLPWDAVRTISSKVTPPWSAAEIWGISSTCKTFSPFVLNEIFADSSPPTVWVTFPNVIVCVSAPDLPDLVQLVEPSIIFSIATPDLLGLSFHDNVRVTLPSPTNLLPSGENLTLPLSIVKEALASFPSPSLSASLFWLLVTMIGLFAGWRPSNLISLLLEGMVCDLIVLLPNKTS